MEFVTTRIQNNKTVQKLASLIKTKGGPRTAQRKPNKPGCVKLPCKTQDISCQHPPWNPNKETGLRPNPYTSKNTCVEIVLTTFACTGCFDQWRATHVGRTVRSLPATNKCVASHVVGINGVRSQQSTPLPSNASQEFKPSAVCVMYTYPMNTLNTWTGWHIPSVKASFVLHAPYGR